MLTKAAASQERVKAKAWQKKPHSKRDQFANVFGYVQDEAPVLSSKSQMFFDRVGKHDIER